MPSTAGSSSARPAPSPASVDLQLLRPHHRGAAFAGGRASPVSAGDFRARCRASPGPAPDTVAGIRLETPMKPATKLVVGRS